MRERFGNDIPEWAEERLGDDDDYKTIIDIVKDNHIVSYHQLIQYLRINRPELAATALTRFPRSLPKYMCYMFWKDQQADQGYERDDHNNTVRKEQDNLH